VNFASSFRCDLLVVFKGCGEKVFQERMPTNTMVDPGSDDKRYPVMMGMYEPAKDTESSHALLVALGGEEMFHFFPIHGRPEKAYREATKLIHDLLEERKIRRVEVYDFRPTTTLPFLKDTRGLTDEERARFKSSLDDLAA